MLEFGLIIPAFVAGVLMFLAPCTLPVIPGYLAFISGVPAALLEGPARRREVKSAIVRNGLFFILGFTCIFVAAGALAGVAGGFLNEYRLILGRFGGAIILFFGLMLLGLLPVPAFLRERRITLPSFLTLGRPSSSFLIGALFALGWSPCIGPILGTILLFASSSATALQGAFLLLVFSLGLAVPLFLTALLIGEASAFLSKIAGVARGLSRIGGAFLVFIGILMLLGDYGVLVTWGYELLDFIEYDRLLRYL